MLDAPAPSLGAAVSSDRRAHPSVNPSQFGFGNVGSDPLGVQNPQIEIRSLRGGHFTGLQEPGAHHGIARSNEFGIGELAKQQLQLGRIDAQLRLALGDVLLPGANP